MNFTALQTLYTLAQCTLDLSGYDCNRCIQIAIQTLPGCCGGKLGGRVLYPSCFARFEVYLFCQGGNTSGSPPLLVPPPSDLETVQKGNAHFFS